MKAIIVKILVIVSISLISAASNRYEAENAIVDENSIQKIADSKASGGYYVNMKEGNLSFKVIVENSGFYTIWVSYSQPNDEKGKIQNLIINEVSSGQISFPKVDTLVYMKASSKVKLIKGINTIGINKSWGWVNIDFIELTPFQTSSFNIINNLVTPYPALNAKKMYSFIKENFQKKIISGAMTNTVMLNDGNYTPNTIENQTEMAWIKEASGKFPALLGFDFLHATGLSSDGEWHRGYTNATISLAEDIYRKGGIPVFCWHWKDPSQKVETFYSPSSNNTPYTTFNLQNAYTDSSCETFNVNSAEYKAILNDIDIIASYLKKLSEKNIPILWRPLHEAAGKWFWWGYSGAKACKGLYRFLFNRLTNYHGLNNLIWIWTTDEAADALDWYPGDEFVDIIGRDYYYYPRESNHSSLVASFEKIKEIFNGKKIISLTENGSIPHPDSLISDEAGWSYFMPWYGDYTMDGWAHDNTASDWNSILNHEYVITLDEMPGWDNYTVSFKPVTKKLYTENISYRFTNGFLNLTINGIVAEKATIYALNGTCIASALNKNSDNFQFNMNGVGKGLYLVNFTISEGNLAKMVLFK